MKSKDEALIINVGRQCAQYSLLGITLIFILFAITHQEYIAAIGFVFALLCFAANGLILLVLALHFFLTPQLRKKIFRIALLMFINIPIAVLYGWLTSEISQLFNLNL